MSVVQVFVGAHMAVVAHLVESETIGRISKLQLDDEVGLLSKFHAASYRNTQYDLIVL